MTTPPMPHGHETRGSVRWLQQWPATGLPDYRIGRSGDELIAEWRGFGTLRASRSGDWNEFVAAPGADASLVGKFSVGVVRALLGHLRGDFTLHGSAVVLESGDAVVLLGDSGSGKSTTAADLCVNAGASLLADDTATIELRDPVPIVTPTEELSWLTPDALNALGVRGPPGRKSPLTPARRAARPAPLAAIIRLVFDDNEAVSGPSVARVRGHDAFASLSLATVRFDLDDAAVALRDFDRVARLAERVPLYLVRRAPRWTELRATRDAVARLCEEHRSYQERP